MTKVTEQASGVVAGTLDISTQGEQDVAQPTDAGAALARRSGDPGQRQLLARRPVHVRERDQACPVRNGGFYLFDGDRRVDEI